MKEGTWSKVSMIDTVRDVASWIDDVVSAYRNRGFSRAVATDQAALALGITPRRAKSFLYSEAFKVSDEERAAIRIRYLRHLDDEAEHFRQRLEDAKARRRQFQLEIQ